MHEPEAAGCDEQQQGRPASVFHFRAAGCQQVARGEQAETGIGEHRACRQETERDGRGAGQPCDGEAQYGEALDIGAAQQEILESNQRHREADECLDELPIRVHVTEDRGREADRMTERESGHGDDTAPDRSRDEQ